MEHEHAVGEVVGDLRTRKVEVVTDGYREYTYVDDELVGVIDRDPKYKLDLSAIKPEIAKDNPYVKLFLEEGIVLEPDTGDGRSLCCIDCGVSTPDSDYCCGLPYCVNCLRAHDCEMDDD